MQSRLGRRLTPALGVLLCAFGVAEVIAHRDDTAAALLFWGGALLGGGSLVVAGSLLWSRGPLVAAALVVIGTMAGMLATAWTILMPLLGMTVIGLALRDVSSQGAPAAR